MDQLNKNHWYILGAGPVGCLWACALREAGCQVSMLVKTLKDSDLYLNQQTIEYTQLFSNMEKKTVTVELLDHYQLSREARSVSHLIIATKAYDALSALGNVLPQLCTSATVITLSNGLGMHHALQAALQCEKNDRQLVQAVVSDGARLRQPFKLTHTGEGHNYIGRLQLGSRDRAQQINESTPFGLPPLFLNTTVVHDIEEKIWHKALVNCVINPLTAFYQCSNGELFNDPVKMTRIKALCEELANIINRSNAPITIQAEEIFSETKEIAVLTEKNTSSMLHDVRKGRQLEIEHLNIYFIRLAQQYNVPCPHNLELVNALTPHS